MSQQSFVFVFVLVVLVVVGLAGGVEGSRPLSVKVNGSWRDVYLSPNDDGHAANISADGRTLHMEYSRRYYAMVKDLPHSSPNASDFLMLKLEPDHKLVVNVTVYLNNASCGCNAAMYLTSMPSAVGSPGANKDWYCDANDVGGNACPEIDLMEANMHGLHTTMHNCTKPYTKETCDRYGYGSRFGQGDSSYGEGPLFAIHTERPWNYSAEFTPATQTHNQLGAYSPATCRVTMTQVRNSAMSLIRNVDNVVPPLEQGMALVFSYWGGDMAWLDSPPCHWEPAQCPSHMTFSDISITSVYIPPN